jgi:hypothetical protein
MHIHTRPAEELSPFSGWIVAAWIFFNLAVLAVLAIGAWWLALRHALADPHVSPAAGLFGFVGTGIGWMAALTFASLGTVCGLIGASCLARPTKSDWTAVVLNGAVVAVSLLLLFALSSR